MFTMCENGKLSKKNSESTSLKTLTAFVKASAVCSVIILPISNYYCIDLIKL